MGMLLHSQAILAISKEFNVDRSQIQGASIGITAGILLSSDSTRPPSVVGDVFQSGMES
jgi:hypothetical protein